ncbi:MAG: stage II sporulation protein P [Thermanaeromonas sp.]|uniref:stage II sporulation protein P n=1 Tax=Thermanaeromonas sp. TaxID=2003697 RepID=UPI00243781F0|nr:stage II sporulation protein P [Thermanaeromonas sp.]MCG0278013.1 stage II sporulation protein P [Thermanaeromonas sp.]
MAKKSGLLILLLTLTLLLTLALTYRLGIPPKAALVPAFSFRPAELKEHTVGDYSVLVDEKGQVLDKMARTVYKDDEFIAEDNQRYRVTRIEGNKAICSPIGKETVSLEDGSAKAPTSSQPVQAGGAKNLVAIYHTHSDESYVPTDGTESIPGHGGIFKVGEVFAAKLRSMGVNVDHDLSSHEPHDNNSYKRSRRTAVQLLNKGPAAIFDIHRDGVPDPDFYRQVVADTYVTKIRLVVGRENQNMNANLDFAKRIKAAADAKYPGLIRGIFIGAGSYNQDLSPRAILLEIGTHTNTREEAQRGAGLIAEVIPTVLGITPQPGPAAPSTSGDWKGVFFVILAFVLGGGAYLIISSGGWDKALARIKQYTSVEWANLLGQRLRRPLLRRKKVPAEKLPNNQERKDWEKD